MIFSDDHGRSDFFECVDTAAIFSFNWNSGNWNLSVQITRIINKGETQHLQGRLVLPVKDAVGFKNSVCVEMQLIRMTDRETDVQRTARLEHFQKILETGQMSRGIDRIAITPQAKMLNRMKTR